MPLDPPSNSVCTQCYGATYTPEACSTMRVPGVLSSAFSLNTSTRQGACKRSLFKSIGVSPENQRWLPKQYQDSTVLCKAPTFTNFLLEFLTVHQISLSNQFVMLAADHSYFQEKMSKWTVYGQLYNMGHVMRKGVNIKSSDQPTHIYSMIIPWKLYYGNTLESFS